jgi:hypothetical protein
MSKIISFDCKNETRSKNIHEHEKVSHRDVNGQKSWMDDPGRGGTDVVAVFDDQGTPPTSFTHTQGTHEESLDVLTYM